MISVILLSILLLALNAFFVAGEFALISARRSRIEPRVEEGSFLARHALWSMEHVSLMMATAQLGITVCTIALGALAKPALADLFENIFGAVGLSEAFFYVLSVVLALGLVAFVHVVFSEMVPKNIALSKPTASALALSLPLRIVSYLIYPLILLLNGLANSILRLLGISPRDEVSSVFTRDEVARLVDESRREGKLDNYEGHLVRSALLFEEKNMAFVSIPIKDWVFVANDTSAGAIEKLTSQTGYSRFPVRKEGVFSSYVHVKDALKVKDPESILPDSLKYPLPIIGESESLRSALEVMRKNDAHLAGVENQNQEMIGLVTLEDVLEELIGEIRQVKDTKKR